MTGRPKDAHDIILNVKKDYSLNDQKDTNLMFLTLIFGKCVIVRC